MVQKYIQGKNRPKGKDDKMTVLKQLRGGSNEWPSFNLGKGIQTTDHVV